MKATLTEFEHYRLMAISQEIKALEMEGRLLQYRLKELEELRPKRMSERLTLIREIGRRVGAKGNINAWVASLGDNPSESTLEWPERDDMSGAC